MARQTCANGEAGSERVEVNLIALKLDPQTVGNAGLYYVCYRLSRMGWNVMPTARNARGIDIVAYDQTGRRFIGIQVKSLSKRFPVPLGKSLDKIMGDWWVIVNNMAKEPVAFILTPTEVRSLAHTSGTGEKLAWWLEYRDYGQEQFREAWHRIGLGMRQ